MNALARAPMQHHRVARFDGGHARPDIDDDGRGFVAEQMRKKLVGSLGGLDLIDLSAADGRVQNLDQHLADIERVGKRDFVDNERLAGFRQDRRFGFFDFHAAAPLFEINEFVVAGIAKLPV